MGEHTKGPAMKKLSPTQLKTLKVLAKKGAIAHHMPYMGTFRPKAYWYVGGTSYMGHIRKGVTEKLIELGFLKRIQKGFEDATAVITPAGREALAKAEGNQ